MSQSIRLDLLLNVTVHKEMSQSIRQLQGVDYDETYSPVAMPKSIRIILAIAAYFDYEIWQMDVKWLSLMEI